MVNMKSNESNNDNKEKVGMVTVYEKDIIERLYERTNSLNEFILTLDNLDIHSEKRNFLHNKAQIELKETELRFNRWWNDMCHKYSWKSMEDGIWTINFRTNEIFLGKISNV